MHQNTREMICKLQPVCTASDWHEGSCSKINKGLIQGRMGGDGQTGTGRGEIEKLYRMDKRKRGVRDVAPISHLGSRVDPMLLTEKTLKEKE